MSGSTYLCEQVFSLVKNSKTKSGSRLIEGHMKSVMTVVSINPSPRLELLPSTNGEIWPISNYICSKISNNFLHFLIIS
jgi:hypothetical protein